jgi:hypothetical protein
MAGKFLLTHFFNQPFSFLPIYTELLDQSGRPDIDPGCDKEHNDALFLRDHAPGPFNVFVSEKTREDWLGWVHLGTKSKGKRTKEKLF